MALEAKQRWQLLQLGLWATVSLDDDEDTVSMRKGV